MRDIDGFLAVPSSHLDNFSPVYTAVEIVIGFIWEVRRKRPLVMGDYRSSFALRRLWKKMSTGSKSACGHTTAREVLVFTVFWST